MKIVCDRCGVEYYDVISIQLAQRESEVWKALCKEQGVEARGLLPCPTMTCGGEMILDSYSRGYYEPRGS